MFLGATFDRNKKLNAAILEYAVETANKNTLKGSDIELGFSTENIDYGDEFLAAESVCRLLEVSDTFKRFVCIFLNALSNNDIDATFRAKTLQ